MKSFLPKHCPECSTKLRIEFGKTEDVIKLVCPNKDCSGSVLKRLQKGLTSLEIKGIGPATIENLSDAGIHSVIDLFDKSKFNEKVLINSGYFKKGRALEKMLDSVNAVKELPLSKLILSLQYKDVGKTFSAKLAKHMSGIETDFAGLQLELREQITRKDSDLMTTIYDAIRTLETNGINIVFENTVTTANVEVKKVNKKVYFINEPTSLGMTKAELLAKLDWAEVSESDAELVLAEDKKNYKGETKCLSFKQVKLLFL